MFQLRCQLPYEIQLQDNHRLYFNGKINPLIQTFADVSNSKYLSTHYQPFAFVIQHQQTSDILLCRDHLGMEPLYYWINSDKEVIVAQSIGEILAMMPSFPQFNQAKLTDLFIENQTYSDETIYQGIRRVDPGHSIVISQSGQCRKKTYWELLPPASSLNYKNYQDYLEHFQALLHESIAHATAGQQHIATEFTAGIDSSAIYCAARQQGLHLTPYMNVELKHTHQKSHYNPQYEKALIEYFQIEDLKKISSQDFDPIAVLTQYAGWFAGPAPYLFFMFAHPLHQAIVANGHRIVLSGFGGDQCVSGQLPFNFYMPELIRTNGYREAWRNYVHKRADKKSVLSQFKNVLQWMQYLHPALYHGGIKLKSFAKNKLIHPYHLQYYARLSEAESSLISGPNSAEVRMRIEYSSLVGKQMGFEYRYPLLHPKLLAFYVSIPLHIKCQHPRGRSLIRSYLSTQVPHARFEDYLKTEGMGIVPGSFEIYQHAYTKGQFKDIFHDLPYKKLINHPLPSIRMRRCIKGYMLKVGASPQKTYF